MKKAVIIGSGFGGLATGIRLAARGIETVIYEKSTSPGGVAGVIKEDGFTFDTGPTIITAPDIINSLFKAAGKSLTDYVELKRLHPFYRIYFHDKTFIDYSGNEDAMRAQLGIYEPLDADNYPKFLNFSKKMHKSIILDGLGSKPFDHAATMLRHLPKAFKMKALYSCNRIASRYFKDFRNRFLFSFQPLFIGGNPFKTPSFYMMISHLEKEGGVFYAMGGISSLINTLVKVFEDLGGKINLSSEVSEIIVNNKKARGIISGNYFEKADIIVSASDVYNTYKKLLFYETTKKWSEKKLDKAKFSMSAFMMFLGVDKKYDKITHHNIILSSRYKELIKDIFIKKIIPEDFSIYLHAPSKLDKTMAPEGCDSLYILVPVPNLQNGIDWNNLKNEFSGKIIEYLENDFELKGLKESIVVKKIITPQDFQNEKNCAFGSPWGMQPLLSQSGYFRPHNRSEDIKHLYLAGSGTHPGAGIPGTLLSAEIAEKLILEDFPILMNNQAYSG